MSWKNERRLEDIEATERVDITCKNCKFFHWEKLETLMQIHGLDRYHYLDELENKIKCKRCGSAVRIALPDQFKSEGFVGGLA